MLRKLWKISDCREKQSHLFLPAKRYVLPKGKSAHERALFKKHSIELDSGEAFFALTIIKTENIPMIY